MIAGVTVPASPHDELDRRVRSELADRRRSGRSAEPTTPALLTLFDAMAGSRLLDIHARRMREHGRGFYTIGSAGHESNAYVAAALRPTDPALLHYRSGGFFLARSLQAGRSLDDALRAVLLSMLAEHDRPGLRRPAQGVGRRRAGGHPADLDHRLAPAPRARRGACPSAGPSGWACAAAGRADAVTVCSFGDASLNHSTAAGALNAAGLHRRAGPAAAAAVRLRGQRHRHLGAHARRLGRARRPAPGHRVLRRRRRRPRRRPGAARRAAVDLVRRPTPPGAAAPAHRPLPRPRRQRRRDRLPRGHRAHAPIARATRCSPSPAASAAARTWRSATTAIADRLAELRERARRHPDAHDRRQVIAPLAPRRGRRIAADAVLAAEPTRREEVFGGRLPEDAGPMTLAQAINAALTDALAARPEMLVFGEDVGRKGGVYGVTRGLAHRFGAARVFDTLLDEQSILGFGLGLGVSAACCRCPRSSTWPTCTTPRTSCAARRRRCASSPTARTRNPMVVRIAGLAYQKGFGGHFHNDNAVGVLRDIPGLVVAVPSRPEDAAPMLRACLAAAPGRRPGQRLPRADRAVPRAGPARARRHGAGSARIRRRRRPTTTRRSAAPACTATAGDLTIVTFGNGVRMSLRVAAPPRRDGIGVRVLDLRWIAPLPVEDILLDAGRHPPGAGRRRDPARRRGRRGRARRAGRAPASPGGWPGSRAATASSRWATPRNLVLLGEDEIEAAARTLLAR